MSHQKPEHETQVRPLIGLTPEQAQLAWIYVVETAAGRKITARLIKNAVHELGFGAKPERVTRPTRQTKAELRQAINHAIGQLLIHLSRKTAYDLLIQRVEALQRQIQPLFEN